ncbi:response regulator [Treponema sp. OttesenSCG-928-L16]|nr:response regulator [Treponema sp. OttesenSCG-928-L16]
MAFLAMVLVSYFYVSGIVQNLMAAIGEEILNTTQEAVSANLSETELSFVNISRTVENMLVSGESNEGILGYLTDMNGYFHQEHSPFSDFMKVYAYVRGEFLDGSGWVPPEDYEPPSRPWYIGAEASGGMVYFSEPYVDAETGGICISFSQEVHGRVPGEWGIVAIDLTLSRITGYVANRQIAGNGYGVLVDDTFHFTAHRDEDMVSLSMMDAGGDYPKLAGMISRGQQIKAVRFDDADDTDSVAFFRTIFNGWHIGVIIPRENYYAQVYQLAFVLSVLGFILMTVLSSILIRTRTAQIRSEEENKSKSSFLARMSHEMRTPMNAIIGMTRIAQGSGDMEKIRYCLGRIDEASAQLLGVINDVLDMSKIEAGRLELSETDFSLEDMLSQILNVNMFRVEEKHQNFSLYQDPEIPPYITADRQLLIQVITNLLSNAVKFTPEGGDISFSLKKLSEEGGKAILQFEVADTGIGISKEQQTKLFHAFEQGDGSISRKYGGTGLGLAISQRIVQLMGGEISVESEEGNGACFSFAVPVGTAGEGDPGAAESAAQDKAADLQSLSLSAPDGSPVFAGKRILLAEDVEINQEILAAMLEGSGAVIDWAENGRQACEMFLAAEGNYDLIFMDIHMPEVDGYEAARCIRSADIPDAETIPIIAMTANVFREDVEKSLAAGMNDHVGKPIDFGELLTKMKKYL